VLRRSEELLDSRRRDREASRIPTRYLDRDLAADRRQLALEIAQAGLVRIAGDDLLDARVGEAHSALLEPVLDDLSGDQVTLGDLQFLLGRVTGETDDLHSVEERWLDRFGQVACSDEEDLREIVGDREVVVSKGRILLRVEHFE
jgi:hypothetical protein